MNDNNNNNNNNNTDSAFFKVFRNRFILRTIYQQLNRFKYEKFKYNHLISVGHILDLGCIELLKYKVMNGEYLTFGNTNLYYKPDGFEILKSSNNTSGNNKIQSNKFTEMNKDRIYSYIKESTDQPFYKSLFKNYNSQYQNELNDKKKRKEMLLKFIRLDSLGALIELLTGGYSKVLKVKEKHLLLAFELNSFSVAEYLYRNYQFKGNSNNNDNDQLINKYWNILKKDTPSIKEYTVNLKFRNHIKFKRVNGKIGFLINILNANKLESKKEIGDIVYSFDDSIWNLTVRQLIESCISISFLEIPLESFTNGLDKLFRDNKEWVENIYSIEMIDIFLNQISRIKNINNGFKTIDEIKEYFNKFTKQQLNTSLNDIDKQFNELIKPLIRMVIPYIGIGFNHFSSFLFYYLRYSTRIDNLPLFPNNKTTTLQLFQYSQDSTECKMKYLQCIVDDITNKGSLGTHDIDLAKGLIYMFIKQEEFPCLELSLQLLKQPKYLPAILDKVTSKEMFQYLYENMNQSVIDDLEIVNLLKKNLKAIEIYKSLYPDIFNANLLQQTKQLLQFLPIQSVDDKEKSLFIHDNLSYFVNSTNLLENIIPPSIEDQDTLSIQQFNYFFKSSYTKTINHYNLFTPIGTLHHIKFTLNEIKLLYFYYNNSNINDITEMGYSIDSFFDASKLLISTLGKLGDIETLSIIFSKYFQKQTDTTASSYYNKEYVKYLEILFIYSSFYGQIQVFKFIEKYYPYLLSDTTVKTINICKKYSNINEHTAVFEFLKNK